MINKITKKYWQMLLLILLVGLLFFTNYQKGTYLIGWDNLQTDLNPWLGVRRSFWAVWQEYQSFGLISGMAHAADLPRALFIWILSLVIPQNLVRYSFMFIMVLIGGLGMNQLIKKNQFAFLGAVFYILNFATVQMLFLPFEPFIIFFAFLPWQIWIFNEIISGTSLTKKNLLIFTVINLLAASQYYVQTVFIVYLIILICFSMGKWLQDKQKTGLKKIGLLFMLIFLINSFWILPQIYFLKNNGQVVSQSKTNQLATEDVYYQNKEAGDYSNLINMEGYYYNLKQNNNSFLFGDWRTFRHQGIIKLLSYCAFALIIVGMLKKSINRLPFLLMFFLIAANLLNGAWPFSWLNEIWNKNELWHQIFRSPFTKFIIPYSLTVSYFFACGLELIYNKLARIISKLNFQLFIFIFLLFYSLPSFYGFYISPKMKVKISQSYINLMQYLNKQDKNKRVALLPEYTFWGWYINKDGYEGSGFLWYGIEQPIVSRTFDVWSDKSESYYWEIKTAIDTENREKFEKILKKYQINYLVVDYSLLPVSTSVRAMQYDNINNLLKQSPNVTLVKKWQRLALFQVNNLQAKNFIATANHLPNIGPKISITDNDTAYFTNGDYQTNPDYQYDKYYPFLDLTTKTFITGNKWQINENADDFMVSALLTQPYFDSYRISNPLTQYDADLFHNMKYEVYPSNTQLKIQDNLISVIIPKALVETLNPASATVEKCNQNIGQLSKFVKNNSLIIQSAAGADACFGFNISDLENKRGYLININNTNYSGRRMYFYIQDNTKRQNQIDSRLRNDSEYYLLNNGYRYGIGYAFSFQNNSNLNTKSVNQLNELSIYLFPVEQIKNISLTNSSFKERSKIFLNNLSTEKLNYYTYKVTVNNIEDNNSLILYQTYDEGWHAYEIKCQSSQFKCQIQKTFPFIFGEELKNHVLINNWANGWEISNQSSVISNQLGKNQLKTDNQQLITIIFWPQYLEYIGFILLIIGFFGILFYSPKEKYGRKI